jgi:hypothetical protein
VLQALSKLSEDQMTILEMFEKVSQYGSFIALVKADQKRFIRDFASGARNPNVSLSALPMPTGLFQDGEEHLFINVYSLLDLAATQVWS